MSKIYIMDMAEEEFESWNGAKRIADLFAKRIDYQEIAERPTGNAQAEERWLYMQKHKRRIIIKNRIHGFLFKIIRKIYYMRWVKKYIDGKKIFS